MVQFWFFWFPLILLFNYSFSFKFKPALMKKVKKRFVSYQIPQLKNMIHHVTDHQPSTTTTTNSHLVDLPELALDSILERLSPSGLCSMAGVCSSLRVKCVSDHLWLKHFNTKWGSLIGAHHHVALRTKKQPILIKEEEEDQITDDHHNTLLTNSLITLFSWINFSHFQTKTKTTSSFLPNDSIMALYLSLETGNFSFPAQVYNRENGHVGFLLSCYDAQISYDSQKDTFQARYSPYGRRMVEDGIQWNRLRAPPVNTPANHLHISDCLSDLKPGDHIEIQWRRSKQFPYGWWYAMVGHIESCDGNEHHCLCHYNDMAVLEFKQYPLGSRWRRTIINRKEHKEEGNEADGFYGGIRRLQKEEDISTWKQLWPNE